MANFSVTTADGSRDVYPEGSKYSFNAAGLLVAVDPDRERRTYSPSGWHCLQDVAPKSNAPRRILP